MPNRRREGLATRTVRAKDEGDGGDGGRPLYVLPGFFGQGRNWSSFARRLVALRTDWEVVLVDLRLHGDSLDLPGPHTLAAAADDVLALHGARTGRPGATASSADGRERPAVLGHSFGGKVALEVTRRLDPPPVQTWIVDSTPARLERGGSAERMLRRLDASPPSFSDREAGTTWIAEGGFDEATARWMATNLVERDGAWRWRFDLGGLRDLLEDFGGTDLWPVVESPPVEAEIHLVRAASGSLLAPADAERIGEISAHGEPVTLHELEGGHMLHVDNLDGLIELVAPRLPR